jgi:hypothetical protein
MIALQRAHSNVMMEIPSIMMDVLQLAKLKTTLIVRLTPITLLKVTVTILAFSMFRYY